MINECVKERVKEAFSILNVSPGYPLWIAEMTIINLPIAVAVMHTPEKNQAIIFTFQYRKDEDVAQLRLEQLVRYSMLKSTTLKDWSDPVLTALKQINLTEDLSGVVTYDGDGDSALKFYYSYGYLEFNLFMGSVPVEDSMLDLWLAIYETMETVASKALLIGLLPKLRQTIKRSLEEEIPTKKKIYDDYIDKYSE